MKRHVLFSFPSPKILNKIKSYLLPPDFTKKHVGLMLAEGNSDDIKFLPFWEKYFTKNNRVDSYQVIDNSQEGKKAKKEISKLKKCNILMICGGNTFGLINNLRKSGLDKTIKNISKSQDYIIAGFSAGAIVQTPRINLALSPDEDSPNGDENKVNIKDLTGLNLIPYEIYPHYKPKFNSYLKRYRKESPYMVKTIKENEFIIENI